MNTQRCFNVEIWLILRRDVAQPKHNVVSTLVFQRQIRNVETTLKQRWEKSFFLRNLTSDHQRCFNVRYPTKNTLISRVQNFANTKIFEIGGY